MEKYINDRGEVGVLFGCCDENFALSSWYDDENKVVRHDYLGWMYDPIMVAMVLEYDKLFPMRGYFVSEENSKKMEKIVEDWQKYIKEVYKDIINGSEYDGKFPDINNVGVAFILKGEPFVIVDRNDLDPKMYGEEVITNNIIICE